jgi:hypothetical protein
MQQEIASQRYRRTPNAKRQMLFVPGQGCALASTWLRRSTFILKP